jgi:hypothetical protein
MMMVKRATMGLAITLALLMQASAQIVSDLERGGSVFWKFNSGQYEITGGMSMSGGLTASDPLEFAFQDLNNDGIALDVRLNISELFPDIGIDYSIDLIATVISDDGNTAIVRWFASDDPNQCLTVNIGGTTVQALVTRIEGALQGIITRIPCQANPYDSDWRSVSLLINENGGDANNYLRAEGYLFCVQIPTAFTVARIFNMDWDAYGGGILAGDVNRDGIVDDADLLAVLFAFGQTGSDLPEDINGDGVVDDADLLTVLFNFGSSC